MAALKYKVYPFHEKLSAFLKGTLDILTGGTTVSPMAEVAMRGLGKEGLPENKRREYLMVIAESGSTRQIKQVLLSGIEGEKQDFFAKRLDARYEMAMAEFQLRIEICESAMAARNIGAAKNQYQKETVGDACELLKSGKINGEMAQVILAAIICNYGKIGDAISVLSSCELPLSSAMKLLRIKALIDRQENAAVRN